MSKLNEKKEEKYSGLNITLIHQLKKKIEELNGEKEKYSALINTTDTGYVIISSKGIVLDANKEYVRLTGHHNLKEIIGRNVLEWTASYEKEKNAKAVMKCAKQGFIRNLEIDYADKQGRITPIEINATVLQSKEGAIIMTLCRDITERKKAEEALKESEEKFRAIFKNAGEGILMADAKTKKFTFVNPAICKILGYKEKELLKLKVDDIHPKKDLPYVMDQFKQQLQKKILTANLPVLRKDKKIIFCSITAAPLIIKGKKYLAGFFLKK